MAVRDVIQAAAGVGGAAAGAYIEDVFSTYLYAGNGSTQTITNGVDLSGEGGLVWLKQRGGTATGHTLMDTDRGTSVFLSTNTTSANSSFSILSSFNSDGFTIGQGAINNASGQKYASWTFRKAPKFFDVVTYTGDGVAGRQIPHNLGSVPGCIIIKVVSSPSIGSSDWVVYHRSTGNTQWLGLNLTSAAASGSFWNNTSPTDAHFTLGLNQDVNRGDGTTYVAYLFAHDAGGFGDDGLQNVISCGSYVGNGSNSITNFVNLGWEPQWVLIKNAGISPSESENWYLVDNMRGSTPNEGAVSAYLRPNLSSAEVAPNLYGISVASQGFYAVGNDGSFNRNGQTYIYIAIRRPMKTPESGTEVYTAAYADATPPRFNSTFPVDMGFYSYLPGSTPLMFTRLLQGNRLTMASSAAESTDSYAQFDYMDGYNSQGAANTGTISWMFRRAPGFFDVVAYTGDSTNGRAIQHSLGVKPELIIVKCRNAGQDWVVQAGPLGAGNRMFLNSSNAASSTTQWGDSTEPTDTYFYVGATNQLGEVNYINYTYVAYLFASIPGVSKVGTYTGLGSSRVFVDCGFSNGARFVLVKRTDGVGNWFLWDTTRGIVGGTESYIRINTTTAQVTTNDYIDPHAPGFSIPASSSAELNASGGTYLFLAIA